MAVTDILGLWQLAATILGEVGVRVVTSAITPVKPYELTFQQIYDQTRLTAIRASTWDFAKRRKLLRLAPTKDFLGITNVWNENWNYVYAPPVEMVKFIRFGQDIPGAGIVHSYLRQRLPIFYEQKLKPVSSVSHYVYSDATAPVQDKLYRGWVQATFFDESHNKFTIVDVDQKTTDAQFLFMDSVDLSTDLTVSTADYHPAISNAFDLALGEAAGVFDFGTADYPASIVLEFASGDPYAVAADTQFEWADHIVTNLRDAMGVYLVDIVDPGMWPEEFQTLVASEMALRAASIHSKSSKVITRLENEVGRAQSVAVSNLTSDDGVIVSGAISSAEMARL